MRRNSKEFYSNGEQHGLREQLLRKYEGNPTEHSMPQCERAENVIQGDFDRTKLMLRQENLRKSFASNEDDAINSEEESRSRTDSDKSWVNMEVVYVEQEHDCIRENIEKYFNMNINKFSSETNDENTLINKFLLIINYTEELKNKCNEQENRVKFIQSENDGYKEVIQTKEEVARKFEQINCELKNELESARNNLLKSHEEMSNIKSMYESKTKEQIKLLTEEEEKGKKTEQERQKLKNDLSLTLKELKIFREGKILMTNNSKLLENKLKTSEVNLKETMNQLQVQQNVNHRLRTTINEINKLNADLVENLKNCISSMHSSVQNNCQTFTLEDVKNKIQEKFVQTSLKNINKIKKDMQQYEDEIQKFNENRKSKTYLHINEMLQRGIEKLDDVESKGISEIQSQRKSTIEYIHNLQKLLHQKVAPKGRFNREEFL